MSEEPRQKWDRFPADFRQRALEQMKTSKNVKALAKELGVARQQLYQWRQQAEGRQKPIDSGELEDPRDRRIPWRRRLGSWKGSSIRVIGAGVDFFLLQRLEKTFAPPVFPRPSRPAHTRQGPDAVQPLHIVVAGVL